MKLKTIALAAALSLTLDAGAAVTHNIVQSYQTSGGSLTGTTVVTDNTELNTDVAMTSNVTNSLVNLAIARSQLKSLCLSSTVYTWVSINSTSAPANTFLLVPATPQIGTGTNALSLTADVTSLYLSCTNTNGGTFSIRSVLDTTVATAPILDYKTGLAHQWIGSGYYTNSSTPTLPDIVGSKTLTGTLGAGSPTLKGSGLCFRGAAGQALDSPTSGHQISTGSGFRESAMNWLVQPRGMVEAAGSGIDTGLPAMDPGWSASPPLRKGRLLATTKASKTRACPRCSCPFSPRV